MMGRRLADQGQTNNNTILNSSQIAGQGNNNGNFNNGAVGDQNAIMGISGGMVRLKGNSPKVSGKDSNRPRNIKQFGG